MHTEDTRSFEEMQRDTGEAYRKAGSIFSTSAYILIGVYAVGIAAQIGLLYMKGPWIIESVRAVVLQNRTFLVILISLLLSSLASNIKDQSFTAVKVGRVVAFFMLAGVPVFTVLGIIALTRLFNKNL